MITKSPFLENLRKGSNDVNWETLPAEIAACGIPVYPLANCNIGSSLGAGAAMTVYEGTCFIDGVNSKVAFKEHHLFNQN